jgi:SHS2 domain-containing protein
MSEKKRDFEFFEHPADAKFQAYGKNLEEAFRNATHALVSLMLDREKILPKIEQPVIVEGKDLKQLLVGFLEEVLYLLDSRSFLLNSVVDLNIERVGDRYILRGQFCGDRFEEGQETFGDVKAITYHEMMIEQNSHVMVQVVVDV